MSIYRVGERDFFKKLVHVIVGLASPISAGQFGSLETQGRLILQVESEAEFPLPQSS